MTCSVAAGESGPLPALLDQGPLGGFDDRCRFGLRIFRVRLTLQRLYEVVDVGLLEVAGGLPHALGRSYIP